MRACALSLAEHPGKLILAMRRTALFSLIAAVVASPANAADKIPPVFFGVWGSELIATKECRAAAFPHDASLLVKVDATGIEGTEFGCKVRSATPARSPGVWTFDMDCSGEGTESRTTEVWKTVQIGLRTYLVRTVVNAPYRTIDLFMKCK